MNNALERIWKEAFMAQSRYYSGICLGDLGEPMKTLNQCPSGDPSFALPTYQSTALSLWQSVRCLYTNTQQVSTSVLSLLHWVKSQLTTITVYEVAHSKIQLLFPLPFCKD
jgi:hypothetical protein